MLVVMMVMYAYMMGVGYLVWRQGVLTDLVE